MEKVTEGATLEDVIAQLKAHITQTVNDQNQVAIEGMKADLAEKLAAQKPVEPQSVTTNQWTPPDLDGKGFVLTPDRCITMTGKERKVIAGSRADEVHAFQQWNDDCVTLAAMVQKPVTELKLYRDGIAGKAPMATGTSGAGSQWVPTIYSSDFTDKYRLQLKVAAMFPTIDMPGKVFVLPTSTADATAYVPGENTAPTAVNQTTSNVTLTAVKVAAYINLSDEIDEDASVAVLPIVQQALAQALYNAKETAIINGDKQGGHMDSDTTDAADVRKAFDGLRQTAATASTTLDLGTFTTTNLRALRAMLGKYGIDQTQLAWITSINGYTKMLGLAEVLTRDKYGAFGEGGPVGTVLSGELAKFDGAPVIVSEFVRQDLNALGVYDGQTTDNSQVLIVNHRQFIVGNRLGITVESWYDPKIGQHQLVARERYDFQPLRGTTGTAVAQGYNVAN